MADGTCVLDGCTKPLFIKARGWCAAHYAKWRKYGDPLAQRYGLPRRPCKIADCDRAGTQGGGHGWCEKHYRRYQRHGSPFVTSRIVGNDVHRFETYIVHGAVPAHMPSLGPCWLWTGPLTKDGYGVMEIQDMPTASAHRWSYRHHVAELVEDLELDHLCRVRRCVNPWHLDQVPHQVNIERSNALRSAS